MVTVLYKVVVVTVAVEVAAAAVEVILYCKQKQQW